MAGRLEGRVAVLIGAARGIGAAIAERFVEEGAKIVIGDTEVEAAQATVAPWRRRSPVREDRHPQAADAERTAEMAQDAFGKLDILVQKCRYLSLDLIENIDPTEWDSVMAVNLKGTFLRRKPRWSHAQKWLVEE